MTARISHVGLFNDGGTPFALAAAIKTTVNNQANFEHYGKLAKRTTNQGECDLCGAGDVAVGVLVDVSPKGDTCTVETKGYEWVKSAAVAVGDLVTPGANGLLAATAGATPTLAEFKAGVWQVDDYDATKGALICLDARL